MENCQIIGRNWDEGRKKRRECVRCKSASRLTRHHICYNPSETALLCAKCHGMITAINTINAFVKNIAQNNDLVYCNIVRRQSWKLFLSIKGDISIADMAKKLKVPFELSTKQYLAVIRATAKITTKRAKHTTAFNLK